jgi:hypothetical protein
MAIARSRAVSIGATSVASSSSWTRRPRPCTCHRSKIRRRSRSGASDTFTQRDDGVFLCDFGGVHLCDREFRCVGIDRKTPLDDQRIVAIDGDFKRFCLVIEDAKRAVNGWTFPEDDDDRKHGVARLAQPCACDRLTSPTEEICVNSSTVTATAYRVGFAPRDARAAPASPSAAPSSP